MGKEYDCGYDVACKVLHHIDTMYPVMWDDAPKSARESVGNTIIREVRRVVEEEKSDLQEENAELREALDRFGVVRK